MRAFFSILFLSLSCAAFALEIDYAVSMPKPETHCFHVRMEISGIDAPYIDAQLPAWSPGRYLIVNFSRHISELSASADGKPIDLKKIDKQTWRAQTQGINAISIEYQVYANTLNGTHSQLNDLHAFIDGAGVFMYIAGHKPNPVSLAIEPPPGWMILSSAGEEGQTTFEFANYDLLIDNLVQLGAFFIERFTIENTEYRVSIMNNGDRGAIPRFVGDVRKLQETAVELFGPLDTDRYTFFFHFLPDYPGSTGMEHLDCCQVSRNYDLTLDGDAFKPIWSAMWVAAHELIHAWNIKRLRPAPLGPWDYTAENYTPLLWLAEGGTSYLADLILLQSGVWNETQFLDRFDFYINDLKSTPGRLRRSVEESSIDTWLWEAGHAEHDWDNVWASYYIKGELIGMCMDLEIRRRTKGAKTIIDFFNLMYQRFYTDADAETYYFKGKNYTTADVLQALEETTGDSWDSFYQTMIASPGEIPYNYYLSHAGLQLFDRSEKNAPPRTGIHWTSAAGGYPKIARIDPGSPADAASLMRSDTVVAIDGERALRGDVDEVLRRHAIDGEMAVSLLRGDRLIERTVRVDPEQRAERWKIEELNTAPPLAKRIRREWLGRNE